MMHLEHVRALARADSEHGASDIFQRLLVALETGADFSMAELYALPYDDFEAAVGAIREWRTYRYVVDLVAA
jgi:hypothetical protein